MINGGEIIGDIPLHKIQGARQLAHEGFHPVLAAVHPVAAHSVGKTTLLIHSVEIFCELAVQHEVHNAFLPWEEVDGAFFSVGREEQLNTRPVDKPPFCQLLVQLRNILQRIRGEIIQGTPVVRHSQCLTPAKERLGIGAYHRLMQCEFRINSVKRGLFMGGR